MRAPSKSNLLSMVVSPHEGLFICTLLGLRRKQTSTEGAKFSWNFLKVLKDIFECTNTRP